MTYANEYRLGRRAYHYGQEESLAFALAVVVVIVVAAGYADYRRFGGLDTTTLVGTFKSTVAVSAFKAGTTAGMIWATERLRRTHPKTAVFLTIAVDGTMAGVVAHNYAQLSTRR